MMMRTRARLVPFVLCTTGILLLFLAGCRKEEKGSEIPPNSPASYMNDPAFKRALEEKRHELSRIVAERKPLVDRMQALVREHGEDLAALQKIPEWTNLYQKVTELNAKYQEVRKRQLKLAGDRLKPAGEQGSSSAKDTEDKSGNRERVKKTISK